MIRPNRILTIFLLFLPLFNLPVVRAVETPTEASGKNIEKQFAHPERIRYDGSCMTIEGEDVFIYSAAFHYFRYPEALWHGRCLHFKEGEFQTRRDLHSVKLARTDHAQQPGKHLTNK